MTEELPLAALLAHDREGLGQDVCNHQAQERPHAVSQSRPTLASATSAPACRSQQHASSTSSVTLKPRKTPSTTAGRRVGSAAGGAPFCALASRLTLMTVCQRHEVQVGGVEMRARQGDEKDDRSQLHHIRFAPYAPSDSEWPLDNSTAAGTSSLAHRPHRVTCGELTN